MRPRFTIRELFWMILVAALAMGWLVDHHRWKEDDRYVVREVFNDGYLSQSPSTCLEIVDRKSGRMVHAQKP
jgi:hypothetical protein